MNKLIFLFLLVTLLAPTSVLAITLNLEYPTFPGAPDIHAGGGRRETGARRTYASDKTPPDPRKAGRRLQIRAPQPR